MYSAKSHSRGAFLESNRGKNSYDTKSIFARTTRSVLSLFENSVALRHTHLISGLRSIPGLVHQVPVVDQCGRWFICRSHGDEPLAILLDRNATGNQPRDGLDLIGV